MVWISCGQWYDTCLIRGHSVWEGVIRGDSGLDLNLGGEHQPWTQYCCVNRNKHYTYTCNLTDNISEVKQQPSWSNCKFEKMSDGFSSDTSDESHFDLVSSEIYFFWEALIVGNWTGLSGRQEDIVTLLFLGLKDSSTETAPIIMAELLFLNQNSEQFGFPQLDGHIFLPPPGPGRMWWFGSFPFMPPPQLSGRILFAPPRRTWIIFT